MSVPVTITLNSIVGSPGPFNLYSCTGLTCSGTPFVTGVTLISLTNGYGTSLVPDGTTHIKIKSTGIGCDYETTPISIIGIPTPTPTPTSTSIIPTPTPTSTSIIPTPTPTSTTVPPTPTPTSTTNTEIDPTYYYYAMGPCSDMKYSYTAYTQSPFPPPVAPISGCDTLTNIATYSLQNPIFQQYKLSDPLVACGFGGSYVSTIIARSSTQITNETVFNIGGQCLAVIAVDTQYVSGTTIDLSGVTPVGTGWDACTSCSPPFTGFTIMGYSGVTCDTDENVLAYSLLGGFTLGNVYGIQLFSGGTVQGDARCVTLNANLGPMFVIEDPETEAISGYQITDAGPGVLQLPISYTGYTDCDACEGVVVDEGKYQIDGERCDDPQYSVTLWSDTAPTVVSGNTIQISGPLSEYCWRVTLANQFKSSVVLDLGYTIIDTGCDCNGDNGGGNINVDNIVFEPSSFSNTGSECNQPMGQYYTEATSTEMLLTFKDSSNNSVTPNGAVEYRVNGGTWQPLTVTGNTVTFSVTLIYGDNTNCTGGTGSYADTLDIKVGTVTVDTYTAGQA